MNSCPPKVTVGMPVYNGEQYMCQAIDSILSQTYHDFELIISDNASNDATQEICENYLKRDPRVTYIRHKKNMGGPKNWNYVFLQSKSPYFKWASANDLCHKEMLEKGVQILDSRPDVILCYFKTKLIDERATEVEDYNDNLNLTIPDLYSRYLNLIDSLDLNNAESGLIRSDILRKTKLEGIYKGGDIPLMAELCLYGKFYEYPEFLYYRRISSEAWTSKFAEKDLCFFINPDKKNALKLQNWKFYLDIFHRINRTPIGINNKIRLSSYLLKIMYWRKDDLINEVRLGLKSLILNNS